MSRAVLCAIAIMLLLAIPEADAADCEYKTNKTDLFTKERHVRTDWIDATGWLSAKFNKKIGAQQEISVAANREGNQNYLTVRVKLSDAVHKRPTESDLYHALVVPRGSTMLIAFIDESFVELRADTAVRGTTRSKYDDGWYVITSRFVADYLLDAETADALTAQDALAVRITAGRSKYDFVSENGNIDFEFGNNKRGAIRKSVECLLQAPEKKAT